MCELNEIKNTLMCYIQKEVDNLEQANYLELGAAIDMIKDLEEAMYYNKMIESMGQKEGAEKTETLKSMK